MTTARLITLALLAVHWLAVGLGLQLQRRLPAYRSMARAVLALAVLSTVYAGAVAHRAAGLPARLAAYAAGFPVPPYEGAARWSWAAEHAARAGFYVVLALAVLQELWPLEFNRRALQVGLALQVLAIPALWALYPWLRGDPARSALIWLPRAAVLVQLLAAIAFVARQRPSSPATSTAQWVALVLAASALFDLGGPLLAGRPELDWWLESVVNAGAWLAVSAVVAHALWRSRHA